MKFDHCRKFSNLSRSWENQGFNGILTCILRDTSVMLYQLNYEATFWEQGQFIEFISSREEWNDVKCIQNNSYLNCGCRWKWRMIIAVNFPIWATVKNKAEEKELNKLTLHPMSGFIAQLVEHRTGIAKVTSSNPIEALIFSGFFFPIA